VSLCLFQYHFGIFQKTAHSSAQSHQTRGENLDTSEMYRRLTVGAKLTLSEASKLTLLAKIS